MALVISSLHPSTSRPRGGVTPRAGVFFGPPGGGGGARGVGGGAGGVKE